MKGLVPLSTVIDGRVKSAAQEFCRRHGLKLRSLVEQALIERLEDEIDLEAYLKRRTEPTVPLEQVLAGRPKKKR